MKINTRNINNEELKKFLIRDFWQFIEQHKYFITVSLDNEETNNISINKLLQSLNKDVFSNITSNLMFNNSLYIEYDLHVIKEFLNKYLEDEDFINVRISKDFIVVSLDIILKSLNVSMEELIKYK